MHAIVGAALVGFLSSAPTASVSQELIDQFVATCVGTLPQFEAIDATLEGTDFQRQESGVWLRASDSASFQVREAADRYVCMLGIMGDHTAEFTLALSEVLEANELGRFERRVYQGRSLFLLQAREGMTILEVIPPSGATTFLVANALKE